MTIPQFKLKDLKPDQDFIEWNELMSHKQDIELYYEGSHPLIKWVEKIRLNAITKLIKNHIKKMSIKDPAILEAGCGTGHVLLEIARKISTKNLIGLDPLDWWLDKAKKRLGDKAKLIKGFAEDLPFKNNSVDIAVCTEVIEHVIDPKIVLKELNRVTKNDGLIIISIPNEKLINLLKDVAAFFMVYQKLFSNIPKRNDEEWHIHSFNLRSFKKYIPEELEIKSLVRIPTFFLPLRYVITFKKI